MFTVTERSSEGLETKQITSNSPLAKLGEAGTGHSIRELLAIYPRSWGSSS